jgi:hypothetical protein
MADEINELLKERAEKNARLKLIPYDGSLEIKELNGKKYIYIRKKILGKNKSTYLNVYSDEIFASISTLLMDAKKLKKEIRKIEKRLHALGYSDIELSSDVLFNIDFARSNMKECIYDQAILEGIATTFPDTETIIDNGVVNNMKSNDVQKILNLKHAWEFIMDYDVLSSKSDIHLLSHIAGLVNEGFFYHGDRLRTMPVTIGGTDYIPPIPRELEITDTFRNIIESKKNAIDVAIDLCLYTMKAQPFNDGNKRTAVIFANHYLISKADGLLVIPEAHVKEFKKLLVSYYEGKNEVRIKNFMKENCWKKMK